MAEQDPISGEPIPDWVIKERKKLDRQADKERDPAFRTKRWKEKTGNLPGKGLQ